MLIFILNIAEEEHFKHSHTFIDIYPLLLTIPPIYYH